MDGAGAGAGRLRGAGVHLRPATIRDRDEFLAAEMRSRKLHRPWTHAPSDDEEFAAWLKSSQGPTSLSLLVCLNANQALAGVVGLSQIYMGHFRNAYLGYYAFEPHHRTGHMTEAICILVPYAFSTIGLHRLEANIQPENKASIALIRRCGFRYEGLSPRYLKIAGRWRDHERWALTREDLAERRKA